MRSDQLSTSSFSSIYSIDEIDLTDPIGMSPNQNNNDPISDNSNNPIPSSTEFRQIDLLSLRMAEKHLKSKN